MSGYVTIAELLDQAQWLRTLARQLVADRARADDIVQQTWLAALRQPPARGVSVRAWLASVARNFAHQSARGDSHRARRESRNAGLRGPAATGAAPAADDVVERAETQRALVDAVLALSEPYRSTILMRYFDGLGAEEIARQKNIPASTVRVRVKRGLSMLRERLDGSHGGGDGRSWVLALIPFARGQTELPPAPISSPVFAGALSMTTNVKIVCAAGLLVVLSAALWPLFGGGGTPMIDQVPVSNTATARAADQR